MTLACHTNRVHASKLLLYRLVVLTALILTAQLLLCKPGNWIHSITVVVYSLRDAENTAEWTAYLRKNVAATAAYSIGSLQKTDVLPGVTVSRSITIVPQTAQIVLDVDGHPCEKRDVYGDNVCHWDWNATLGANIHSVINQPIQHGDYIQGDVKVR